MKTHSLKIHLSKCYVCGRKVAFWNINRKLCCHRECFELAWKLFVEKKDVSLNYLEGEYCQQ
jgi:hypothetical protein